MDEDIKYITKKKQVYKSDKARTNRPGSIICTRHQVSTLPKFGKSKTNNPIESQIDLSFSTFSKDYVCTSPKFGSKDALLPDIFSNRGYTKQKTKKIK